jgi:hypothetical protein
MMNDLLTISILLAILGGALGGIYEVVTNKYTITSGSLVVLIGIISGTGVVELLGLAEKPFTGLLVSTFSGFLAPTMLLVFKTSSPKLFESLLSTYGILINNTKNTNNNDHTNKK